MKQKKCIRREIKLCRIQCSICSPLLTDENKWQRCIANRVKHKQTHYHANHFVTEKNRVCNSSISPLWDLRMMCIRMRTGLNVTSYTGSTLVEISQWRNWLWHNLRNTEQNTNQKWHKKCRQFTHKMLREQNTKLHNRRTKIQNAYLGQRELRTWP